ncbi:AmmeMemoRadiSam system protein B [Thalassomonas viridans]|uniref:MEMO1 family protein SG34_030825 n=1 Tax=Thalassomonas viridans TaxID=137584 RepID=A0AAF0CDG3_9GAMM|nr:AmmeMemoRadiSam system protein B [Thalassomonas viridans]WDE09163.1 AmmeMemoRadiSam system protein B [Thalassomonas viridans]
MKNRAPVVAGSFYPESSQVLQQDLSHMLASCPSSEQVPKGLIVPHAGYCYSGNIAASGYATLKHFKDTIKRVILLGPSHRVYLHGCAVPHYDFFSTPLGKVPVDEQACLQLVDAGLLVQQDQPHALEHSLEVQLPFLQTCLDDFQLVPVVVGEASPQEVCKILDFFAGNPEDLIVVSSDLSHYHNDREARVLDQKTIEAILAFNLNLQPYDACGCHAVNGLLDFAHRKNWHIKLLEHGNSGDTSGDKNKVVGYASFILY